ncbi:cell division protein SepF [Synechococcus lacustris]|uniref:cell division protein SepF n=1 Tax=Synechococcus lacustris TaxID=2116544 RepID=UPI0020CCCF27|nr:cell division protein SepF [Synechococcus lacustris]MCP9810674.1 cell division protein SepF [Synechococcus lacustris Maggiore-St4-Slac]
MSLFSRLKSVVTGDDYLDSDYDDDLEYDEAIEAGEPAPRGGALSMANQFDLGESFIGSNVIGMPGISSSAAEVIVMEPRSFDEMPKAIQALRERKTIIINLTMMEPDQAQRAVDFVAGGTFAIDGHQERVGESIFLFAPSCVTVTTASTEESASPSVISRDTNLEQPAAPSPAWGRTDALNG